MLLSEIIQKSVKFLARKKSDEIFCVIDIIYPQKVSGCIIAVDFTEGQYHITSTEADLPFNDPYWETLKEFTIYKEAVEYLGDEKLYVLSLINKLI